jgi:exopolysaccharide biosynthesis predicted pyruvyltransferase EpsI
MTGVKTASITQTSVFSVLKTIQLHDKIFCTLMPCQPVVIPSFIQINNSVATDFWRIVLIWHGIPEYLLFLHTFSHV